MDYTKDIEYIKPSSYSIEQSPNTSPNFFETFKALDYFKAIKVFENLSREGINSNKLMSIKFDLILPILNPLAMGGFNIFTKDIAISPNVLNLSANAITHIILHESLHAGWHPLYYGIEMHDEAITEFVTRQIIKEIYNGYIDFTSGYLEIVGDLENLFANRECNT